MCAIDRGENLVIELVFNYLLVRLTRALQGSLLVDFIILASYRCSLFWRNLASIITQKRSAERQLEYPWLLIKICKTNKLMNILDVGCYGSVLPLELSRRGHRVMGVDIRPCKLVHRNFEFVRCDICNLPFRDNSFDAVSAISTIEHVGLGAYGDKKFVEGDRKAVLELFRVIRGLGKIFMTVPVNSKYRITESERVYDRPALNKLLTGRAYSVSYEYYAANVIGWHRVENPSFRSIVCLTIRKIRRR